MTLKRLRTTLAALSLTAIDARLDALLESASKKEPAHADFLLEVMISDADVRRQRYVKTRLQLAHLPYVKTFDLIVYRETAGLAKQLIEHSCEKQQISPGQLTIHADRGSSMTSKSLALLLADLGVVKTHSQPHVSHDNPFSEAHFKTMKYRPGYPDRFGSIQDARRFCQKFFAWYNHEPPLGLTVVNTSHGPLRPSRSTHFETVIRS
jgi:transposase InsO family protein